MLAAGATITLALAIPAAAGAQVPHLVAAGESLYSIAAADGLSVTQLAAANGLSPNAQLTAGSTILIPPQGAASAASSAAAPLDGDGDTDGDVGAGATAASALDGDGDTDGDAGPAAAAPSATTTAASYVVQPGDTLSAIATRAGISVAQLAAANGLSATGTLLAGSTIAVPGAAPSNGATASPPIATGATPGTVGPPYPTPTVMSASQVGSLAAAAGAPAPLADAVGWQESGFNNDLVSPTGAVGVMQIEPATWNYINEALTPGAPLDPYSASDNVTAGSLYLRSLLAQTGNPELAAASYYQGLSSVQRYGMFPSTQQYVHDVMALESQYGGG
jgi:LysM repeat protein